ncbi:hypothetical protein [Methanosarcina sp. UBA289]|uniref:hypothetical protein n=1 Tax=Methanosarcina sp. UBA289 TaxID=1915574 RepID=UPI0025F83D67|nr:hypothetical protein [Methanosarcina sp. UBA289]
MKCPKKPAERKRISILAYSPKACKPEHGCSSENSLFHYSIIETHPINYEYGSSPVRSAFTVFSFSGPPIKTNLTMKSPENYLEYAEKCSQS